MARFPGTTVILTWKDSPHPSWICTLGNPKEELGPTPSKETSCLSACKEKKSSAPSTINCSLPLGLTCAQVLGRIHHLRLWSLTSCCRGHLEPWSCWYLTVHHSFPWRKGLGPHFYTPGRGGETLFNPVLIRPLVLVARHQNWRGTQRQILPCLCQCRGMPVWYSRPSMCIWGRG